jgi:hypothetical protein
MLWIAFFKIFPPIFSMYVYCQICMEQCTGNETLITREHAYSFFILYTEFHAAHTQTKICRNFPHSMKGWSGLDSGTMQLGKRASRSEESLGVRVEWSVD